MTSVGEYPGGYSRGLQGVFLGLKSAWICCPLPRKALSKYSESTTEYQRRRIDRTVAALRRKGERVASWKIYRMASLRPNIATEVKQYVSERADETVKSFQVQTSAQNKSN